MKQWQIFLMLGFFLLVCTSFENAEAAPSHVTISTDISSADIMVDDYVIATLTIDNSDTRYRTQDVYLMANWPGGTPWDTHFIDVDFNPIEDNKISMSKGEGATVKFAVFCVEGCFSGDTNAVQIYAKTDPRFYNYDGNVTDTCGSDDCETDTTPASSSTNVTNSIVITFTARTAYASMVECDAVASIGDYVFTRGDTYLWGYTLTNTGWYTDTYQFTAYVTSESGAETGFWIVNPGLANGKELTGQSDTSTSAVHSAEGEISIRAPEDAASGVYNVELTVASTNGAADSGCNFEVVVPADESITVSVAKVDTPPHPEWEWNYTWLAEVDDLETDMDYTAIILIKRVGDEEWEGLDWRWDIEQESKSKPFALQRGCYHINANLYEINENNSNVEDGTVLASADLDFAVGNGICVDGVYYVPISEVDEDPITTEEEETETETIELDESEEVVSISLISALVAIGVIATVRRK